MELIPNNVPKVLKAIFKCQLDILKVHVAVYQHIDEFIFHLITRKINKIMFDLRTLSGVMGNTEKF